MLQKSGLGFGMFEFMPRWWISRGRDLIAPPRRL